MSTRIEGVFTPTQFYSAADKAKFARQFVRFVESGFKSTLFPKWFYNQLSHCFGHIAHYNQSGFYATWFESPETQLDFLNNVLRWHCCGSPEFTFSDVERALRAWVLASPYRQELVERITADNERRERAELERLQNKYSQ